MKLSKKILAAFSVATLLTTAAVFTSCAEDEDVNDMLNVKGDKASIDFTNDTDTNFSRAFHTTNTKHLSADMKITIDLEKSTKDATGGLTTGYVFNVKGSGKEKDPYSFGLIGIRCNNGTPQYFVSYYTGVLSADCTSDSNDFDTDENNAYEYAISKTSSSSNSWSDLPNGSYTKDTKTLTVYIDLAAYAGTTEITKDNASAQKANADSYKITFKSSETATSGTEVTVSLDTINAGKGNGGKSAPKLTAENFKVEEAKLGYYAMVAKNKTLVANWERSDFVLSDEVVEE